MIQILNKELFWKNLDTCSLLILALKEKMSDIKLSKSYELLVTTIPPLTDEGLNILETVFIETSVPDDSADEDQKPEEEEDPVRAEFSKLLKRYY